MLRYYTCIFIFKSNLIYAKFHKTGFHSLLTINEHVHTHIDNQLLQNSVFSVYSETISKMPYKLKFFFP